MQANESLVKKFGPKCHLVGIYYPYTYFQIIYKSLYVGWRGIASRQKTNFPSKNSCGKPYKTKSHLTKFLANHLEKSKSISYI